MVTTRLLISKSSGLVPILWGLYQRHQLPLVSSLISCSTASPIPDGYVEVLTFLFGFFQLYSAVNRDSTVHYSTSSVFLCRLFLSLVVCPRLGDPFEFQNPRGVCASLGHIPSCVYTICQYRQISISGTVLSRSPCPPSRVQSYTLSVIIYYICLLSYRSFRLYHHITYIFFVEFCLFLL